MIYTIDTASSDYTKRLRAAERRAQYELGDGSWAHLLVRAFLHPDEDTDELRAELEEAELEE